MSDKQAQKNQHSLSEYRKIPSKNDCILNHSLPNSETELRHLKRPEIFIIHVLSDDGVECLSPNNSQAYTPKYRLNKNNRKFNNDQKSTSADTDTTNDSDTSRKRKFQINSTERKLIQESNSHTNSEQDEIIESESNSMENQNTRLNLSEFLVSESSPSVAVRPKLKNVLPTDKFERFLAGITKDKPEMSHHERVQHWKYSTDVSDVEDYLNSTEYELNNITSDLILSNKRTKSKPFIKNQSTTPQNSLNNNTKKGPIISYSRNLRDDDNILMSINTQTRKAYRNNKIISISSDTDKSSSKAIRLIWTDNDSVFSENCLNPDIDKTRSIKNSPKNYKRKHHSIIHKQMIFKMPNIPRKYLSNRIDSTQKEEFYKYLGIGTRSPNGKNNDKPIEIKRRSLRVRQLQQLHQNESENDDDDDVKNNFDETKVINNGDYSETIKENDDNSISPKSVPKIIERCPTDKIGVQKQIDNTISSNKMLLMMTNQSNDQRSCNSSTITTATSTIDSDECNSSFERDLNQMIPFRMARISYSNDLDKNNVISKAHKQIFFNDTKSIVITKHTYNKTDKNLSSSLLNVDDSIKKFTHRDLLQKRRLDEPQIKRYKNGIQIPYDESKTNLRKKSVDNFIDTTLLGESKINTTADHIYKKFQKFLTDTQPKISPTIIRGESKIIDHVKEPLNNSNQLKTTEMIEFKNAYVRIENCEEIKNYLSRNTSPIVEENKPNENDNANLNNLTVCLSRSEGIKSPTIVKRKHRKIWSKSRKVKMLRSLGLNQIKLRNKKLLKIVTTQRRRKMKQSKLGNKRSKSPDSNKSTTLLSSPQIVEFERVDVVESAVTGLQTEDIKDESIVLEDIGGNQSQSQEIIIDLIVNTTPNLLANPLSEENGIVLHAFFDQDFLIVVQEDLISFWKYLHLLQLFGKSQQWESLGKCRRKLEDKEITSPYKNRLCVNETNPVYLEFRAKQFPDDPAKQCNMASVYVNVYYFNIWKAAVLVHSVQLDTIRGLATDINYTTIKNTRYFIMCWKQESPMFNNRTGLCKYSLTPDLDTLASIREFRNMRHTISQLECLSDDKLIGFGKTQITIWDHRTGDVLTNIDIEMTIGKNLGSILYSVEFKEYLILYQMYTNDLSPYPELKILAVNLSDNSHSFRVIYIHKLPESFLNIRSSLSTSKYIIITALNGDEYLLLPQQPHNLYSLNQNLAALSQRFYLTGSQHFVEITKENLVVKTIHEFLMDFVR